MCESVSELCLREPGQLSGNPELCQVLFVSVSVPFENVACGVGACDKSYHSAISLSSSP